MRLADRVILRNIMASTFRWPGSGFSSDMYHGICQTIFDDMNQLTEKEETHLRWYSIHFRKKGISGYLTACHDNLDFLLNKRLEEWRGNAHQ